MIQLFTSITICLLVGFAGSYFTIPSIPTWYQTLIKPDFTPPSWVFGPVWTILYIMMGIFAYLVRRHRNLITIFIIQLSLNFLWSVIFFGLHLPLLALIDIVFLWFSVIYLIFRSRPIHPIASYLLLPYLFWVSFASILNLAIVILNPR